MVTIKVRVVDIFAWHKVGLWEAEKFYSWLHGCVLYGNSLNCTFVYTPLVLCLVHNKNIFFKLMGNDKVRK